MIKKITYILLIFCMISSCGKKGDPVYKNSQNKTGKQIIFIVKT